VDVDVALLVGSKVVRGSSGWKEGAYETHLAREQVEGGRWRGEEALRCACCQWARKRIAVGTPVKSKGSCSSKKHRYLEKTALEKPSSFVAV
jgi:hypothetical protein